MSQKSAPIFFITDKVLKVAIGVSKTFKGKVKITQRQSWGETENCVLLVLSPSQVCKWRCRGRSIVACEEKFYMHFIMLMTYGEKWRQLFLYDDHCQLPSLPLKRAKHSCWNKFSPVFCTFNSSFKSQTWVRQLQGIYVAKFDISNKQIKWGEKPWGWIQLPWGEIMLMD